MEEPLVEGALPAPPIEGLQRLPALSDPEEAVHLRRDAVALDVALYGGDGTPMRGRVLRAEALLLRVKALPMANTSA